VFALRERRSQRAHASARACALARARSQIRFFYDPLHELVLLLEDTRVRMGSPSSQRQGGWTELPFALRSGDVRDLKLSGDKEVLAVQTGDTEVVRRAAGRARACVCVCACVCPCRPLCAQDIVETRQGRVLDSLQLRARGSNIFSLRWVARSHALLLLTANSIELFEAQDAGGGRRRLKSVKSYAAPNTAHHWLLDSSGTLLAVDNKGVFQAFQVTPRSISRTCKFELDSASKSSFHQISLHKLYARTRPRTRPRPSLTPPLRARQATGAWCVPSSTRSAARCTCWASPRTRCGRSTCSTSWPPASTT
jgi:hypothetical protein